MAAGLTIEEIFRGPSASVDLPAGVPVRDIDHRVMNAVTDVESPRDVLAVVAMPSRPLPSDASFVVVLAGVADPGNAGTIIRSAEAAGADGIVFTVGSVDPYNPKCVRASAGALFHLPVVVDGDPGSLGLRSVGTSSHAPTSYLDADLRVRSRSCRQRGQRNTRVVAVICVGIPHTAARVAECRDGRHVRA